MRIRMKWNPTNSNMGCSFSSRTTAEDSRVTLRNSWEIDHSEIKKTKKLGEGNYTEVHCGKWKKHKLKVVTKTLKAGVMPKEVFLEQASLMRNLRHDHLVTIYGVCSHDESVFIVQEYMCNGNLLEFLREGRNADFPFEELLRIAAEVAAGMEYLEENNVIHRQLSARNVLLGENLVAKVADSSIAKSTLNGAHIAKRGSRFSIKFTAPEAVLSGIFTIKSDVWSYGNFLMELFTYGRTPFASMPNDEIINRIESGYRIPKPSSVSDEIYSVMLMCWDASREKRPSFATLREFFEECGIIESENEDEEN